MITDGAIKTEFILQVSMEEFARFKAEQLQILENKRGVLTEKHFDVDKLISDVMNRQMNVSSSSSGITFEFQVLKKLRFADMKKLGNAKVYNRPLWGIIFGQKYSLMTRLRSEYIEQTHDAIYNQLKEGYGETSFVNL